LTPPLVPLAAVVFVVPVPLLCANTVVGTRLITIARHNSSARNRFLLCFMFFSSSFLSKMRQDHPEYAG
jgi:hypothetical protein